MLKRRLIPVLFIKNGLIVRSEKFSYHQNIGNVVNEAQRYSQWNVDELIYIDISRDKSYDIRRDDHKIKSANSIDEIIKQISRVCFMPLTFGGGIRNIDDVRLRIRNGADKISLNTGAINNPKLIQEVALEFGRQCVVMSIDYRYIDNQPIVFTDYGTHRSKWSLFDWIKCCEENGAGELFINSIDRDGMATGYDLELFERITGRTRLPIIACGGAADEFDILELAQETQVSAFAVGNWFHFVENSYSRAKRLLNENSINIR